MTRGMCEAAFHRRAHSAEHVSDYVGWQRGIYTQIRINTSYTLLRINLQNAVFRIRPLDT